MRMNSKLNFEAFKKLIDTPPPLHKVVTVEPPFVSKATRDTKKIAKMSSEKANSVIVDGRLNDSDAMKEAKEYFSYINAAKAYANKAPVV